MGGREGMGRKKGRKGEEKGMGKGNLAPTVVSKSWRLCIPKLDSVSQPSLMAALYVV